MKKYLGFLLALALALLPFNSPALASISTYSTLTGAQEDQLNRVTANSAVSSDRWVYLGTLVKSLVLGDFFVTAGADSAATNYAQSTTITTPVDTTGTNSHIGHLFTFSIGNATGGTNTADAIKVADVTGDAQVNTNGIDIGTGTTLGTSYGIKIGSGWDAGISTASPINNTLAPGADSGVTNKASSITLTSPVDTTGTNVHEGIDIGVTIGNASGGTNTVNAVNIGNTAGDAQVIINGVKIGTNDGVGTTHAINIGAGWDDAMTIGAISGYPDLEQNATVSRKLFIASDTVASGQTAKTTTVTGLTAAAKCVATGNEIPSNTCYIKSAAPGSGSVVVTVNTDPGASNLDYTLACWE